MINLKKISLLFLLFIMAISVRAEKLSVTITKSFLIKYDPVIVLIHNYDGVVIHTERIKKRATTRNIKINFESDQDQEFALTSISFTEKKGRERFVNFTFLGITDGSKLEYQETSNKLQKDELFNHQMKLSDYEQLGEIINIIGADSKAKMPDQNILNIYSSTALTSPLFFILATDSTQHYYYLNNEEREAESTLLVVPEISALKLIDKTYPLSFPYLVRDVRIRANLMEFDNPIHFSLPLKTNHFELPFPDDLGNTRFDVIAKEIHPKFQKFLTHYLSVRELPFSIDDKDEPYDVIIEEPYHLTINTSSDYTFFKVNFLVNPIGQSSFCIWKVYGALDGKKCNFKLPAIADDIVAEFPILNMKNRGSLNSIDLILSEKRMRLEELPSPFIIDDVEWRLENSATVVSQTLPKS